VGPGEYHEQLVIPSGVTLTSQIPHRAVIRGPDTGAAAPAVTANGTRDARVHGFQIVGDDARMPIGVLVLNGELELQDMRITGAVDAGVDVWGTSAVTLRANDIVDNAGVGVRIRSGARPSLLHNRIVRNGRTSSPAAGVLLEPGAMPRLVGNVIADNGAEGIAGVPPGSGGEFLRNNVFVTDTKPNARGVFGASNNAPPEKRGARPTKK
jgi:parallel beta-helix repeat protein